MCRQTSTQPNQVSTRHRRRSFVLTVRSVPGHHATFEAGEADGPSNTRALDTLKHITNTLFEGGSVNVVDHNIIGVLTLPVKRNLRFFTPGQFIGIPPARGLDTRQPHLAWRIHEDDRIALADAVAKGLVDVISSMHTPQDEESKRLPFEEAASGAVALETLVPAALQLAHADLLDLPTLWRALSSNPAKLLNLSSGRMEQGAPADLVLFDANKPFVLDRMTLNSKSKNTPFDGRRMQGVVERTYCAGKLVYKR